MSNPYERDLDKNPANFQPLTPLSFLERAAMVFPDHVAVTHGARRFTYADFYERCRRLGSALAARGIGKGDTVATLVANVPAQLEAHYGVPMIGAVLNAINYRLSPWEVAFILDHGEAKVLLVDPEFAELAQDALKECEAKPLVIDVDDEVFGPAANVGEIEYEALLKSGDPDFAWEWPADEWDAISLNYTSGTTGNPKGVVYHHRGAYLSSVGTVMTTGMAQHPVYLWTLPMFHCNGWCFTWAITAATGTHVCLRRVEAGAMYEALAENAVTDMCGAPIVMNMLVNATDAQRRKLPHIVRFNSAAAPPPAAVIAKMEEAGFKVTHLYGLTETYGPATVNAWRDEWDSLPLEERAKIKARQGVRYVTLEGLSVRDPDTMEEVPRDGETMGEVMFRGNMVMKGYLKNPTASEAAFKDGWFHSGDLGVWHTDNYIQLKDRSKDIIISGGENISSIEVEDILYKHPHILEAAVVGKPDEKWGETPVAFVNLKPSAPNLTAEDVIQFCRDNLAHYKCPRHIVFGELPKTSTGKIQKFKLRKGIEDVK
jgi:fatty-acyl-CoA synthase